MTEPAPPQPVRLPGGAQLAPGETVLMGGRFMYSTLVFYRHSELVLTNRRLYTRRPNMTLGLIQIGAENKAYPVENIAGVSSNTEFHFAGVIIGVLTALVGLFTFLIPGLAIAGVLLLVLAVVVIINAPRQSIDVMNSGGGTSPIRVSFFERNQTVVFANGVSEMLARTTAREPHYPQAVAAPVSASSPGDQLRNVQTLREQGLITEEEYAAKRAEILARM